MRIGCAAPARVLQQEVVDKTMWLVITGWLADDSWDDGGKIIEWEGRVEMWLGNASHVRDSRDNRLAHTSVVASLKCFN